MFRAAATRMHAHIHAAPSTKINQHTAHAAHSTARTGEVALERLEVGVAGGGGGGVARVVAPQRSHEDDGDEAGEEEHHHEAVKDAEPVDLMTCGWIECM